MMIIEIAERKFLDRFKIILLLVYLIPFVILLWFVNYYGVNVPFSDDWSLVNLFTKIHEGKINPGDFFAQHFVHRMVFPKIIFVTLAFFSKWNLRYELNFSIFLAAITFFLMYRLSSISYLKKENYFSKHLTNILTCALVFSLVQIENWLWGFQLAWFWINACLLAAILIIALSYNRSQYLYLAAVPCFLASFSSAHGLLTWLAVIPLLAAIDGSSRQRIWRISIWLLFFVFAVGIYHIGYQQPNTYREFSFFLKQPLFIGNYFFSLLGNSLAYKSIITPFLGITIFLLFIFQTCYFFIKSRPKFKLEREVAAWISIGLFALLFAIINTAGRAGTELGIEQALASRYTTVTLLLIIASIHLWRLLASNNRFIVGVFVGLVLVNSINLIPLATTAKLHKQAGKTCLELVRFIEGEPSNSCLEYLYAYQYTNRVKESAEVLQKIGFLELLDTVNFNTKPTNLHGYIDSPVTSKIPLSFSKNSNLSAAGWAILPDSEEQPKTVLFSYGNSSSFFASAIVGLESPDVANYLNSNRYNKARWAANISLKSLPLGETVIKAWVYNPASKQLIQLSGEPKIKVVE